MEIERLTKDKVMRPSLIESVDKINEVIDAVNLFDPTEINTIESRVDNLETNCILKRITTGAADGALISVTANGHAEQDGTPTPSDPKEIVVVRGRNLFDKASGLLNAFINSNGVLASSGGGTTYIVHVPKNTDVTISGTRGNRSVLMGTSAESNVSIGSTLEVNFGQHQVPYTFNTGDCSTIGYYINDTYDASLANDFQLELGSTVHPYVPYGHVGLDVTAEGTTTTTPIPLPSRGWVGSLPDGTHDTLAIDGAGKVTWELADAMTNAASTEGVTGTIGVDVLSTTGEIADGATVLYKTTPTTEVMGYVDLPDIPEGAVVSTPELDGLGVESWNNDVIYRYVSALIARAIQ
jgi:hypothetical protein